MAFLDKYQSGKDKEKALRHEVSEVLRAYRHPWDVFSEAIQNSIDAINSRYKVSYDPNYYLYEPDLDLESISENFKGRIKIFWAPAENTIIIEDNGIGIPFEKIDEFLFPKGTGKKAGKEYGFKGYGLTFLAFISESLKIESRNCRENQGVRIKATGFFNWVCNDSEVFPEDNVSISKVNDIPVGTKIEIKLADNYSNKFEAIASLDTFRNNINKIESFEALKFIIRTKTAVGNTSYLFGKNTCVDIIPEIHLSAEGKEKSEVIPFRYFHPKDSSEVEHSSYSFQDYINNCSNSAFERKFRALFHTITDVEIGKNQSKKFNVDIGLCAISKTRLGNVVAGVGIEEYSDGRSVFGYRPGIHLSINGMPTGITIDDWTQKGSGMQRYFVIVDADLSMSQQLDPGRKGISGHYAELITSEVEERIKNVRVNESFDTFRKHAITDMDVGRSPDEGDDEEDLSLDAMYEVIENSLSNYNSEERELLTKIKRVSSFEIIPSSENESISLFYDLLGRGFIKGYKSQMVSSRATYDAIFGFNLLIDEKNLHNEDPLGVSKERAHKWQNKGKASIGLPKTKPGLCIEFKRNLGAFLKELKGKTDKDPASIDILICWDQQCDLEFSSDEVSIGEVLPNQRAYHSVTHKLSLQQFNGYTAEINCIILKSVINKIA